MKQSGLPSSFAISVCGIGIDASRDAKINRFALNNYSTELRNEFKLVKDLNSMAVQAAAERGWLAISLFYDNCRF